MDSSFWHQRWADNEIGFHEATVNARLVEHFDALQLEMGNRIFVPLCGKTLDIGWLLSQGLRVAGVELSSVAVDQLFDALGTKPTINQAGEFGHYQADGLDIWVGDIFTLTTDMLGPVDAIYDRAALVALPVNMRERYCEHIIGLTHRARQLLICYDYDQSQMPGPPFAVSEQELQQHYQHCYSLSLLASHRVNGGIKGQVAGTENIWLLQK